MEALQRLHNRGSISTGYNIDNSCKFEDDNDEYLYRTNASGTNRKTWTVSWWFKQTEIPSTRSSYVEHWQGGVYGEAARAGIDNNDRLWIDIGGGDGNTGTLFRSLSSAKLRDTLAWYHVVIACDSTQSTEADRLKVWLNGVEVTSWDQHQIPTLNFQSALQGTGGVVMKWGSYDATYNGYSGYLAECNYVDGVTATQNDFGEFDEDSGIWKPIEYTGSYGTNGSYLDFEIASDLGANAKGNDVNFSLNNITSADQSTDTPTNNFATLNTLFMYSGTAGANPIFTEGATVLTTQQSGYWHNAVSTIAVTRGKWYFEAQPGTSSTHITAIGYGDEQDIYTWGRATGHVGQSNTKSNAYIGSDTAGSSYGRIFPANSSPSTRVNYTSSNIIGVAIDADNGYVYWSKDGTFINSGDPTSGSSGTGGYAVPSGSGTNGMLVPSVAVYHHTSLGKIFLNFGGYTNISISSSATDANGYGTFEYAPPSGYYALCTKNLEEYG